MSETISERPTHSPGAPSGTLTFLFTDIEGSTELWQQAPDAMRIALERHDAILRAGIERHGGFVFKTAGDAFCAAFAAPQPALRSVLELQRALHAQAWPDRTPIRVRMALHSGEAEFRNGDYFGHPLNLVARLMSASRGGQTLVSPSALPVADEPMDGTVHVESHGRYRFKGIEEPVEVFEVSAAELGSLAPPEDTEKAYRVVRAGDVWQPVRAIPHNLPAERDAFVGRVADLRAFAQRLDAGAKLSTVVGPAGTGKTRFVRRYGLTWLGDWPGGVYFCDLSEASSLDGILFTVALALDVPLGKGDPVAQLGHAIAGRGRCLVILDNFEQIVPFARDTVGRWMDRAADAAFVVTSRERLHLPGEEIFPIEPLPVEREAIDLFVSRARAQRPDFVLGEANLRAVAEVVRLLEGLPLAIELAAARVRVFSPAQLVERMRDRFQLLAGAHGASARQATLRAAIEWSWDLLTAWERSAFAQCSAFEGGFTMEAAEAVIDLASWPEAPPAMDAVQALVDKSLLRVFVPAEQRRYGIDEPYFGMYVSLHEFAAEKLDATAPGAARPVHERHAAYFARFGADEALDSLERHGGVLRRRSLALELDNLVAACRRSIAQAHADKAVAAYRAAWTVLELQGPFAFAMDLGAPVLAMESLTASLRASATWTRALVLWRLGRLDEAEKQLDSALADALELGDRWLEAGILGSLGNLYQAQGRLREAAAAATSALAIHRERPNRRAEGTTLGNLANVDFMRGSLAEARVNYDAALAIHREVGNRVVEGSVLSNLAGVNFEQGRMEEALACCEQALAIHREVGDRRSEGVALGNLGLLYRDQGKPELAQTHFEAAIARHRELGDRHFEGLALHNLGSLCEKQGRVDEALAYCEASLNVLREVGNRYEEGVVLGNLGALLAEKGRLAEARQAFQSAEALIRKIDSKLALVKLLCHRGQAEVAAGELDAARSALAEAEMIAAAMDTGPASEIRRDIAKLTERLG